jgi:hypothetical protein
VYRIESLTTGATTTTVPKEAATEPKQPRGQSPAYRWLKLPSLGFEDGGVTLRYNNALKFAGRWTGIASLRLSTSVENGATLGANYNLRGVTNDLDLFLSTPNLQNDFLSSFYYIIRNQEPLRVNDKLFERKLFTGFTTAWNTSYQAEDGNRNEADIPFSFGIGGGGPILGVFGFRGQASYERVADETGGEDTRLALTGVLGMRSFEIARGINVFLRAEGTSRFGDEEYTWYRGNAGLTLLVIPQARISAGYYRSWENGEPRFPYDQVSADHGYTARLDVTLGRTRLGYMNQFSDRRNGWFRNQVYVARRVGVVEPFLAYDEQFSSYSFGFNLDTQTIMDHLTRRRVTGVETPRR